MRWFARSTPFCRLRQSIPGSSGEIWARELALPKKIEPERTDSTAQFPQRGLWVVWRQTNAENIFLRYSVASQEGRSSGTSEFGSKSSQLFFSIKMTERSGEGFTT